MVVILIVGMQAWQMREKISYTYTNILNEKNGKSKATHCMSDDDLVLKQETFLMLGDLQ